MVEEKVRLINIYCDESRQTNHRYMVLGGLWMPADKEIEFHGLCNKFRSQEPHLLTAFFKWGKASKSFLKYYKQFVDLFFDSRDAYFKSIIVDTHKIDYDKYHEGDKELAFYKFHFFLLSRKINPAYRYLIMLHRRNNKKPHRLECLKHRLNNYLYKMKSAKHQVVSNIEPRDSRLYNQLQLADIFIGYLGYRKEGYETSPAKLVLSKHIDSRRLGLLAKIRWRKFDVWEWRPSR